MLTIEIKREVPYRDIQWKTIGNIFHKYHGKAYTRWYDNGQKHYEVYRTNGELHRDPAVGPAYTDWYPNGQKSYEEYWENSRLLNLEEYQC